METFPHKVAALYSDLASAQNALEMFRNQGFGNDQLDILTPNDIQNPPVKSNPDGSIAAPEDYHTKIEPEGSETAWQVVKSHVLGATAGGAAAGVAGGVAIAASGATLFLAAPVIATLAMAAWGAMVGATVGTMIGMETGEFQTFLQDAVKNGHYALIIHTRDDEETERIKTLLKKTVTTENLVQSDK